MSTLLKIKDSEWWQPDINNPKGDNLTLTGGGGFSTRMILSTFIRNLFPGACVFMIFFSGISRVHVFFGISILAGYIYIYIFFDITPPPWNPCCSFVFTSFYR